jgi:hypothetical protein
MQRFLALALLIAPGLWCAPATAQVRGGGFGFHPGPFASNTGVNVTFRSQVPFHRQFAPNSFFIGAPWFADYPVAPVQNPQIIVIQQPAVSVPQIREEPKPINPLLIELQGDHYVRRGDQGPGPQAKLRAHGPVPAEAGGRGELKASAAELPNTLLVFRDGHREEVNNYSIFHGSMYVSSDYWTSGRWTRQIQIADLDLPATTRVNQEIGVRFTLPTASNEVVTRP